MEDLPLEKIAISGPTLASIIQRFSSSSGDVDGLLFGHVTQPTSSDLPDDDVVFDSSSSSTNRIDSPTLIANITGYFCSGTAPSFYDSLGRLDVSALHRSLGDRGGGPPPVVGRSLIGWFVGRRKTHLRPSMRESSVSASLSTTIKLTLNSSPEHLPPPLISLNFPPCVFIVFSTPLLDQLIHTHEYRAFQFRPSAGVFERKSVDIVNIGPAFRGHYSAFCPNSPFPSLPCILRDSSMEIVVEEEEEDKKRKGTLNSLRQVSREQRALNSCAEGFEVGRLSRLMGSEAANYTSELEGLYEKMLAKLEGLACMVEKTSARVLDQELHNTKLRSKFAGLS